MPYTPPPPLPKLADVERAIRSIDVGLETGPRQRTSLRLLLGGARPIEVAALTPEDILLPASATLRYVPNFKLSVYIVRQDYRRRPFYIRLEESGAQDAMILRETSALSGDDLFTTQSIQEARKMLSAILGQSLSASKLRWVATLALVEKISAIMIGPDSPSQS